MKKPDDFENISPEMLAEAEKGVETAKGYAKAAYCGFIDSMGDEDMPTKITAMATLATFLRLAVGQAFGMEAVAKYDATIQGTCEEGWKAIKGKRP